MKFTHHSVVLALLPYAFADPSPATLQACDDISSALPEAVKTASDSGYDDVTDSYWSTALRDVTPACIVLPESAEEVSVAVNVLSKYPDVLFAVKSGGHDPNPRHASIEDGVLISMAKMVGATYDESTGIAQVKPGGQWNDVIGDVAPDGVTIVGGRLGEVGVGGYLLQGGISFLSFQYGLAADSIVGWKTVMANGSIVDVDATKQPELAVAMRGSGSQFGIVTEYSIKAHPIGQVWGGFRIYSSLHEDQLWAALHKFTAEGSDNPKSAIIHSSLLAVGTIHAFIIFFFHDGPEPPTTGAFADYADIPSLIDITSTQSYADMLETNGNTGALLNARQAFRTYTIPYIPSNPSIYKEIRDKFSEILSDYLDNPLHLTNQCSVDFQPLPSIVGQMSAQAGGNAMGLTNNDPDRLLLEMQCSWSDDDEDGEIYAMQRQLTAWLDVRVPQWLDAAGLDSSMYLPLFMNDAQSDQNVTGSYTGYSKFKALQEEIDPDGFFSTRGGGFTY